MKASHKRTFRTLMLSATIVCLAISAPLFTTTNAKKEARNVSSKRLVSATSLQDEKGERVNKNDEFEVTEIPALSKPKSSGPSKLPKDLPAPSAVAAAAFKSEVEPNDTSATAQPLGTTPVRVRADLFRTPFSSGVDVDFYSFMANAGDRVYAATMTGFSAGSTDTLLDIIDTNGTTILESDDEDGAIGGSASNIAGTVLATGGTYFVRVRQFSTTSLSGTIRPYDLYVRVQSGSPTPETEPNNNGGTPNPVPASGWMSGVIGAAADNDTFSISANAGDTVVAILDVDPERNSPEWNARLAIGIFNNNFLLVNGSAVGGTFDDANPSEAFFMTVKAAGTYVVYVDEALGAGAANFTYNLSVSVIPGDNVRPCTSYAGTGGPITDIGITNFTLNIPDSRTIDNLQLSLNITHAATADLDVSLISPDGNEVVLFDDPPTGAGAAAPQMDLTLDDEAAIPISIFGIHSGMKYQPELFARLAYFKGMQAQGTWTLRVRDDLAGNAGTLNSWSLNVCEAPAGPGCSNKTNTIYSTDFEANAGGFTSSGVANEWERGLPAFAPITTAHSGVNAFKTDLDNTYNANSNQDLLSPNINLVSASGTVKVSWWQKYQFESASFDSAFVEVREVGVPTNFRRLFEWKGATQTRSVGNPAVTVNMSAGWALVEADISDFIGDIVEIRFHLDSDGTGQFSGFAVDDVSVTECPGAVECTLTCPADIIQSNDPNQCGAVVTYQDPTTTGNCGEVNCSPASGSFFPVGTTTVTCTEEIIIGAPQGQGVSCSFSVTVVDNQAPSITCPANIIQSNDPNQCGAVVTYPGPTITDNCPGEFTATCSPASGSFFPVGTTTVTCTVDGFGQQSHAGPNGACQNPQTITHSSSQAITPLNSVSCNDGFGHTDNSYWRAFSLPAFSINNAFDVQSIDVGIEDAVAGGGGGKAGKAKGFSRNTKTGKGTAKGAPAGAGQPITIRLHQTTSGTFPTGTRTQLATATFNLTDQSGTIVNFPIAATFPAGSELIVEVFTPDGTVDGNLIFIGSNSAPETGPSYLSAADCGIVNPTTTAALGFPNMHIVMNVNGCQQIVGGGPSCSFTVTVNDTQPPSITCPPNQVRSNDPNQCGAVVTYPPPTITDNCPGTFTATCTPASGSFFPVGTTTVTCEVDGFGQQSHAGPNGACQNPQTITHSSSQAITPLNSVSCNDGFGHTDNSYWRAFSLPAFSINNAFDVQSIDVGIEEALAGFGGKGGKAKGFSRNTKTGKGTAKGAPAGAGSQPITIRLHRTTSGTFPTGTRTQLATATFNLADQAGTVVNFPIAASFPAGSELIVEVFTPDGTVDGNLIFIGSNSAPETGPSYLSAADCGVTNPTTTAALGFPNMHIVMNVNGCQQAVGGGPSCTFTVTVNDTQPPTITCPGNITAVTDQNVCPSPTCQVVSFPAPVVSDNCPGVTVACVPPSGTCFPVGVTTVTCTVTDASGNTATCTFGVTTFDVALVDTADPTTILLWNSITGQYRFCCLGVVYTGVGQSTVQGCVYRLVHNPADRRVTGIADKAAHGGNGSIQSPAGTTRCTISDQNTLIPFPVPICQ